MRVLIVGCGYVGLPLGAELARQGHEVYGLRRSRSAAPELETASIHPLIGDITKAAELDCVSGRFDWVVNCVSSGGGGAERYRSVYLEGMHNVLDKLSAHPPGRFVYTSSTSVYGQTDESTVSEDSVTEPITAEARILLDAEQVLLNAWRQQQFPAAILRVAGIYGPNRLLRLDQYLANAAHLDGDGSRILNLIHRDDVTGAVIAALQNGRAGEIYNAVDDEPVSQRDFFEWLSRQLNRPMPPSRQELAESRKRGITSKRVSNRKLKSELGYRFRYPSYREGLAQRIEELLSGRD